MDSDHPARWSRLASIVLTVKQAQDGEKGNTRHSEHSTVKGSPWLPRCGTSVPVMTCHCHTDQVRGSWQIHILHITKDRLFYVEIQTFRKNSPILLSYTPTEVPCSLMAWMEFSTEPALYISWASVQCAPQMVIISFSGLWITVTNSTSKAHLKDI